MSAQQDTDKRPKAEQRKADESPGEAGAASAKPACRNSLPTNADCRERATFASWCTNLLP